MIGCPSIYIGSITGFLEITHEWIILFDNTKVNRSYNKLGCAFPMVISSDFRVGQHRDDDHEEDAPYFMIYSTIYTAVYDLI